jgi:hypothetical protein
MKYEATHFGSKMFGPKKCSFVGIRKEKEQMPHSLINEHIYIRKAFSSTQTSCSTQTVCVTAKKKSFRLVYM